MHKRKTFAKNIAAGALIAAIYCVLTMLVSPLSYGVMQIRISEALTILPVFTPAAPLGLFVGCLTANILGGANIFDIIFGSAATLAAGILSAKLKHRKWLAPLPPVLINAVTVGLLLYYVYEVPFSLPVCILCVGTGQAISCYGLGMPLYFIFSKNKRLKGLFSQK